MKAVLFPIVFLAAAVSAQQSSACAADYVVEACLGTSNGQLATCGSNEYQCKCDAYKQSVQYVPVFAFSLLPLCKLY